MSCYKFETKLFFDEGFAQIRSRLSELLLDIAILNELGLRKFLTLNRPPSNSSCSCGIFNFLFFP